MKCSFIWCQREIPFDIDCRVMHFCDGRYYCPNEQEASDKLYKLVDKRLIEFISQNFKNPKSCYKLHLQRIQLMSLVTNRDLKDDLTDLQYLEFIGIFNSQNQSSEEPDVPFEVSVND